MFPCSLFPFLAGCGAALIDSGSGAPRRLLGISGRHDHLGLLAELVRRDWTWLLPICPPNAQAAHHQLAKSSKWTGASKLFVELAQGVQSCSGLCRLPSAASASRRPASLRSPNQSTTVVSVGGGWGLQSHLPQLYVLGLRDCPALAPPHPFHPHVSVPLL